MIQLFTISESDKSVVYLNHIFGTMGGLLEPPGEIVITQLLGDMFRAFNGVILTIGVLVVLYSTVVGIMNTAHQGHFMGKNWNNMWIPIRTVLGIAALVPMASGYSAIQMVMMWFILQGIGAADMLWNVTFDSIAKTGAYPTKVIDETNTRQTAEDLFQALVCDATTRINKPNPVGDDKNGVYYCADEGGTACNPLDLFSIGLNSNVSKLDLGPNGDCGTLKYCNVDSVCRSSDASVAGSNKYIICKGCEGQRTALRNMITDLYSTAKAFAEMDYNYRLAYYTTDPAIIKADRDKWPNPNWSKKKAQNPSKAAVAMYWTDSLQPYLLANGKSRDFISAAVGRYGVEIGEQVTLAAKATSAGSDSSAPDPRELAFGGWMFAGAYYYMVAMQVADYSDIADAITLDMDTTNPSDELGGKYRNNYNGAGELLEVVPQGSTYVLPKAKIKGLSGAFNSMLSGLREAFTKALHGGEYSNPLPRLATFGSNLINLAVGFYAVMTGIAFNVGMIGALNGWALGNGVFSPTLLSFIVIYMLFAPVVLGICALMVIAGAFLQFYVPLIPYALFIFGCAGWLITVVEAMVAGPLVALGIIMPGGHHELMGEAKPALMLLLHVFLRPCLMIFGLMAGMLIVTVLVTMLNETFNATMVIIAGKNGLGIIASIFMCVAYAFLVVAIVNKSFATIFIIPQQVFRWIGGQGEQYGEDQALGAMKTGVTTTAQEMGKMGGGVVEGAKGGGQAAGGRIKSGGGGPHLGGGGSGGGGGGGGDAGGGGGAA